MAGIGFRYFDLLWHEVEKRFVHENDLEFNLKNLNDHLKKSFNLELTENNLDFIKEKYLSILSGQEKPEQINLPESLRKTLFSYVGISRLDELEKFTQVKEESVAEVQRNEPVDLRFLGREDELAELNDFWESTDFYIFEMYGVPMIGKTEIAEHFKDEINESPQVIKIYLKPDPQKIKDELIEKIFGNREFNDFSAVNSKTLVFVRDFEQILKWKDDNDDLHDITEEFGFIKDFLKLSVESKKLKIIIESRFRVKFDLFLPNYRFVVKTRQIKGVKVSEFYPYFKAKGLTEREFLDLCDALSSHTGLLAFAYNEYAAEDDFKGILYRSESVNNKLWKLIIRIIARLDEKERWILSALTFIRGQANSETIYKELRELAKFETKSQVIDLFESLEKKLLIKNRNGYYELNPLVREVCYTFLEDEESGKITSISNLPFFKNIGERPEYNRIRQALEKDEFSEFYDLLKIERRKKNYDKVLEELNIALKHPVISKEGVWNEFGITYREKGDIDEAIEALKKGWQITYQNPKIANELAISYFRGKRNLDEAVVWAKKGVELKNPHSFSVLAEIYERRGDIINALNIAQQGVQVTEGADNDLIKQKERYSEMLKVRKKTAPLKVFLSYAHLDEDIKEEIDISLAPLKNEKLIEIWHDRLIPGGEEWDKLIIDEIRSADIILLLISRYSVASTYIWNVEIPLALEKQKKGETLVIPIFCKPCDFTNMPFGKFQGFPKDAKPITTFENSDEAYTQIAKGIRTEVEKMLENRKISS